MATKTILPVIALFGFSAVLADEQPLELAGFERAVGKWVNSERIRDARDAPWESGTSEWDVRFLPGGLILETPGQMQVGDSPAVSWVQVWGIDPTTKEPFSSWFTSDGARGNGSFDWNGTTVRMDLITTNAAGEQFREQCDWAFGVDFDTATVVCRRQSDNGWWIFRENKGTRTD